MEDKYFDLDPIEAIKLDMQENGWIARDLANWTGYTESSVSLFLNKHRPLTQSFIRAYKQIPETAPHHVLMQEYELEGKS